MTGSIYNDFILLLGRCLLGLVYALAVVSIFQGSVPVEFAVEGAKYYRVPYLFVWLAFILKAVAGICLLLGFKARTAAYVLVGFTLFTAVNYHDFGGAAFMKEISMIGGLLVIAAVGPGRWSLDR